MPVRLNIQPLEGQDAVIARPIQSSECRLVVVAHGAGLGWNMLSDPQDGWQPFQRMAEVLAENGYATLVHSLFDMSATDLANAGSTWGNDNSTDLLDDVITTAKTLEGISSGKHALFGASMGNVTNLNWYRRFGSTANTAGILGVCPACAVDLYRGTDAAHGLFYDAINDVHNVANDTAWNAIKATFEPGSIIVNDLDVPLALWTNDNDTLTPPAIADIVAGYNPTYVTRRELGDGVNVDGHDFSNLTGEDVHTWLESLAW